jgi:hypothetical protein
MYATHICNKLTPPASTPTTPPTSYTTSTTLLLLHYYTSTTNCTTSTSTMYDFNTTTLLQALVLLLIVFRTGPVTEPARPSVQWFNGPTVQNRLNRWFVSFGPVNRTGHKYFEPVYIYMI